MTQYCQQCGHPIEGNGHVCPGSVPLGMMGSAVAYMAPPFEQRVEQRLTVIEGILRSLLPDTQGQLDRERQAWEILRNAMNARNSRLQGRVEALEAMIAEVLRRDAAPGFVDSLGNLTRDQLREHLEAKVVGGA